MKKLITVIFVLASTLYLSYVYQMDKIDKKYAAEEAENSEEAEKERIIEYFAPILETNNKVVITESEQKELEKLPVNIYILLIKKSVETDSGIIGYPPGSILTKKDNFYLTNDGNKLSLVDSEVTNDWEIAKRYISADTANQLKIQKNNPLLTE